MPRFQFTYDIYTGEKSQVIPPIDEMILGISTALDTDDEWVYGGDRDEHEHVLEFLIDSEYINRLRHSPEYHDAVLRYILSKRAHLDFIVPQYRGNCFEHWKRVMEQYGVLGTISIHPNKESHENTRTSLDIDERRNHCRKPIQSESPRWAEQ